MRNLSGVRQVVALALALSLGTAVRSSAHDGNSLREEKVHSAGPWGGEGARGKGMMGRMKEKLGLSDEQADKLRVLFKQQRDESGPVREQMKIHMDTLRLKVDSKASDAEIKKVLDSISADKKKMEAERQKRDEQIGAVLTPAQRAKMILGFKGRGGDGAKGVMKHRMGAKGKDHPGKKKAPSGSEM